MRVSTVVVLLAALGAATAGHWKHGQRKRALWGLSHGHGHSLVPVPPYKKGHDIPVVTHSVLRPLLGAVKLPLHQPPEHYHHHHHHVAPPRPLVPLSAPAPAPVAALPPVVPLAQQALVARPALAPAVVPLLAPVVPAAPPPPPPSAVPQYSYVLRPGNAVQTSYFATYPRYPLPLGYGRPVLPAALVRQHLHQLQLPLQQPHLQQLPYNLPQPVPHPAGYLHYQHQLQHDQRYHHQQLEQQQHYQHQLEQQQHYQHQLEQQQHYQHELEQQQHYQHELEQQQHYQHELEQQQHYQHELEGQHHYHQQLEHEHQHQQQFVHEHQYHQQLEQEHQYNHQLEQDHQLHEHQLHQQQEHQLHGELAHEHQYHQQLEQEQQWSPLGGGPEHPGEPPSAGGELRYHNHIPLGLQPPLSDRQDLHRNDTDTDTQ